MNGLEESDISPVIHINISVGPIVPPNAEGMYMRREREP